MDIRDTSLQRPCYTEVHFSIKCGNRNRPQRYRETKALSYFVQKAVYTVPVPETWTIQRHCCAALPLSSLDNVWAFSHYSIVLPWHEPYTAPAGSLLTY
jgi:hypothetical protein